jgi:hypothetical protein
MGRLAHAIPRTIHLDQQPLNTVQYVDVLKQMAVGRRSPTAMQPRLWRDAQSLIEYYDPWVALAKFSRFSKSEQLHIIRLVADWLEEVGQ